MRVSVDADRCEGHARCWGICPEVFDLDDDGHAVVRRADVPPGLDDRVRDAARNCPERAIVLA
jgi:ferredoxin